jgi:quinol monooxygenase YgiN
MLESQSRIPLTIVSTLTATPGKEQQLRAAMLAIVGPSRRDPGNIDFNIHLAKGSAGEFVIIEHWIDEAILGKHKKGEAFANLLRIAKDRGLIQSGPHEEHLSSITPRNKTCQSVW